MEITDTESSANNNMNTNRYGQKKTERWHRAKIILSLKEMEKVPICRSHRISQMQKKDNTDMVSSLSNIRNEYTIIKLHTYLFGK